MNIFSMFPKDIFEQKHAAGLFASSLVIHVLGLASTVYVILVYNRYLSHGLDGTLYTLASGVIIALVVEVLLRRFRHHAIASMTMRSLRLRSEQIGAKMMRVRPNALIRFETQNKMTVPQIQNARDMVDTPTFILSLVDAPFALVFLLAIYLLHPMLGLVCTVVSAFLIVVVWLYGNLEKVGSKKIMESQNAVQMQTAALNQLETVRTLNAKRLLSEKMDEATAEFRLDRYRLQSMQDDQGQWNKTIIATTSVLVIFIGAQSIVAGNLDFGALIAINMLAARILGMLSQPSKLGPTLRRAQVAEQLLTAFLALSEEKDNGSRPEECQGRIRANNLTFSYQGRNGDPVFESLNFDLPVGGRLYVHGTNASGKTTLAKLLSGLYLPQKGNVEVDGVDLRQLAPDWWRRQLIYMPQEPDFLNATIRENLCLFDQRDSDETLTQYIKQVGLGRWLDLLPDGLDTNIRQSGRELSLGVRRRLALARALATDGQVVILDEPVEGLDSNGVQMVQSLLNRMMKQGKTLIVLSQQAPSHVQDGDFILDLDHQPFPEAQKIEQAAS